MRCILRRILTTWIARLGRQHQINEPEALRSRRVSDFLFDCRVQPALIASRGWFAGVSRAVSLQRLRARAWITADSAARAKLLNGREPQILGSPFLFRTYDRLVNSVEISHLFIALVGSQPRLGPAGCGLPICSCSGVCCTLYLKPPQPRGVRSLPLRRHAGPADLRR